ncbi:hypothetical protein F5Y15DRAFT_171101 [Xylariaceae sp. FL0016]|nr:hypothetical protein F5Y15DRAFT_171101 [Xylariaceae sp. FL0016]
MAGLAKIRWSPLPAVLVCCPPGAANPRALPHKARLAEPGSKGPPSCRTLMGPIKRGYRPGDRRGTAAAPTLDRGRVVPVILFGPACKWLVPGAVASWTWS